jgi:hypothetical protein
MSSGGAFCCAFCDACRTGDKLGSFLKRANSLDEASLRSGVKAAIGASRLDVIASIASSPAIRRCKRLRAVLTETVLQCRCMAAFQRIMRILPFTNEAWIFTVEEGDAADLEFLFGERRGGSRFDATVLFHKIFLQGDMEKLDVMLRHCSDEDIVETLGRSTVCLYDVTGEMVRRMLDAVRDRSQIRANASSLCTSAMVGRDDMRIRKVLAMAPETPVPEAAVAAVAYERLPFLTTILENSPATDFSDALLLAAMQRKMELVRAILRIRPQSACRMSLSGVEAGEAHEAIVRTRTWMRRREVLLWGFARVRSGVRVKRSRVCESVE